MAIESVHLELIDPQNMGIFPSWKAFTRGYWLVKNGIPLLDWMGREPCSKTMFNCWVDMVITTIDGIHQPTYIF